MDDNVTSAASGAGIDRRELIKRAAIAGGVVAWTAPTIQVLGAGTAFGGEPKPEPGTVVICGDKKAKPTTIEYEWQGSACVEGDAFITFSDGKDSAIISVLNGTQDSATQVHGPVGMTFVVEVEGNDQVFTVRTVSHSGEICETDTFHVSCSQTPPVQPGYKVGGLLLKDWFL